MCFRCLSCTGGWLHGGRWRRRIQQRRRPPTESPGWYLFRLQFIFGAEFHLLLMATGLRSDSCFQTQRNTYHYIILKKKEIKWLIQYLKRIWPVQQKSSKVRNEQRPTNLSFTLSRLALSSQSVVSHSRPSRYELTKPLSAPHHSYLGLATQAHSHIIFFKSPFTYTHLSIFFKLTISAHSSHLFKLTRSPVNFLIGDKSFIALTLRIYLI